MNKLTAIMAAALMTASAADAQADVVGLKTNKTVGETIALTANAGVKAQLVWSNGDTEEIAFDGKPQSITVKADSLALTTTAGSLPASTSTVPDWSISTFQELPRSRNSSAQTTACPHSTSQPTPG